MAWEEFSSVLLWPRGGKFEDQYARFNAVGCGWTQKRERCKKSFLRCFPGGRSGRAGSEVLLAVSVSGLYVELLRSNSPTATPGNGSRRQKIPGLGWHGPPAEPVSPLCLGERRTVASATASAAASRSRFLPRPTLRSQPCCGRAESCLSLPLHQAPD